MVALTALYCYVWATLDWGTGGIKLMHLFIAQSSSHRECCDLDPAPSMGNVSHKLRPTKTTLHHKLRRLKEAAISHSSGAKIMLSSHFYEPLGQHHS